MNSKNESIKLKEYKAKDEDIRLLLKKINANVIVDEALKKQRKKGAYISWPQIRK